MDLTYEWRHVTADGRVWRLARIEDAPRILDLWAEMDKKLGKQDRPNLFAMPVVLTLVCEDENGVVQSAVYGEAVVDFTGIGTDRAGMRSVHELFPTLHAFLGARGIRLASVHVPRRLAAGMKKMLPTMTEISQSLASFVCRIRG